MDASVLSIIADHRLLRVIDMAGKDSESKSDTTPTERKKKRPPEFRHLPRDRARKLKKEWIEKKKIKAQWKHEKRKGNIEWPKEKAEELEETNVTGTTSDALPANSDIDEDSVPHRTRRRVHASHAPESSSKPEKVSTKTKPPPQINRTSNNSMRGADKKRPSVDRSKKEHWMGKRNRPTTMREKMGVLLEKIQKNLDSSTSS